MASEVIFTLALTKAQKKALELEAQRQGMKTGAYIKRALSEAVPGFDLGTERRGGDRVSEEYQLRQQYRRWLSGQVSGNGYDPALDQDGEYEYEYWLKNIYGVNEP